ncbi:putative regulatory protein, FmdB family [Mycetocola miduiensis]|uniref:Putative regulatory protein, FmdB family n=1 Tax=Mycetocola miduiensis TaxID=995034 RepID=A0A1I5DVN1_9MICO|nr:FmdB family zinc ribbon protein [Mycetocola miduiensis]SFO03247.1 putative regulatory protein, FmdB family [Mycetocola miduiensis]
MPTYSYKCTVCDTAFDIQQSFTDASLTECPTCQGKLRKLFSAVGVSFNGSGFYRNDSRASESKTSKKPASSNSESKNTETKNTETKKSEPKSEKTASSASSASSSGSSSSTPAA